MPDLNLRIWKYKKLLSIGQKLKFSLHYSSSFLPLRKPPKVEYRLTEKGKSLNSLLTQIMEWSNQNLK
ncbi:MAG: hypothetical protein CMO01_15665 [Thalassobius sp.]|nr:hypothetical protein [Thalassovita sp.]